MARAGARREHRLRRPAIEFASVLRRRAVSRVPGFLVVVG